MTLGSHVVPGLSAIAGWQIYPVRFLLYLEQPFIDGLYRLQNTLIYVSRGTGYWGPPMRVGVSPEITEITLVRQT